jgi:hypothetical protein
LLTEKETSLEKQQVQPLEKEESVQEQKDLGIKGWIKGKK